jgi:uncharacterized protein
MRALRRPVAALGLILALVVAFAAAAQVAVPQLTGRVVDQTATLPTAQKDALERKLRDFETRKGSQVAVLLVPTTSPETIEQFAIRVAEQWKIGRQRVDDGAILVVAKNDRALRIEVGYGLEGALTDVTAKRIIDEIIVPRFRTGDFAGGIEAGVSRMLSVIDGEPLPRPKPERTDAFGQIDPFNPVLLVAVFVIGGIMRAMFGRLFGSVATGGAAAFVAWLLIGTLTASTIVGLIAFVFTLMSGSFGGGFLGGRGGFSGGGFGGGSGGGFSGGGGGFGGGGASGRW